MLLSPCFIRSCFCFCFESFTKNVELTDWLGRLANELQGSICQPFTQSAGWEDGSSQWVLKSVLGNELSSPGGGVHQALYQLCQLLHSHY